MKQIKLMAVALLLVVLVSMPAFAAAEFAVTPSSIAYEVLGTTRPVVISGDTGSLQKPVKITLTGGLTSGDTMYLSLSGGAMFQTATAYNLCAANSATGWLSDSTGAAIMGAGIVVSNTSVSIPIGNTTDAAINSGNVVWLTSSTCGATVLGAFNLSVAGSTPVGSASMNGLVKQYSGQDKLAINAANVVTIRRQVGTSLNAAALIAIDYLTGSANGTTFVASGLSSNIVAGSNSLVMSNVSVPTVNLGSVGAVFNQVLTLTDSHGGDWSGISRVYAVTTPSNNTDALCSGTAVANATIASGNIVLQIPNATNTMSATGLSTTLCVNVAGNVIPSRTIYGAYSYVVSAGTLLNLPSGGGSSATALQAWTPNGYQAFNPYMYVGTSQDTMDVFCRFYNSSTRTATTFVDVYPADGTASTRQELGTVAPNTAATYWGSTIGLAASLPVGTSYAALFTITAPPSQINGVSFMKRSTGDRPLSLYKQVYGTDQYLSQ